MKVFTGWVFEPVTLCSERCSAGLRKWERLLAVLTSARCEKACGKFPTNWSVRGSYSSLSNPTSLQSDNIRSNRFQGIIATAKHKIGVRKPETTGKKHPFAGR